MKIKIGNKEIGENSQPYLILEIARTYENNIEKAKKMIEIAAKCGADAVKIQSIDAKGLMVCNEETKKYYENLKRLERSEEEHKALLDCCKENKIEFLSTPESFEMIDMLDEIGVSAFKVASLDLVYYDFLRYMAKKGKPILLSSGMASEEEIKKAIEVIRREGNNQIVLLHCLSLYPPKIEELNLGTIKLIEKMGVIPGFSDHTPEIKASLCAMGLGAKVIEKHFKIDSGKGSEWELDYEVAINPEQVKELVSYSKAISEIKKKIVPEKEIERRKVRGRKIVAGKNIKSGEKIKRADLICRQNLSEEGIDCSKLQSIVGKKLKKNIKEGTILRGEDLG